MHAAATVTLASLTDYVGILIVVGVAILSWMINHAKSGKSAGSHVGSHARGALGTPTGRSAGANVRRTASDEPTNLTMAQRIERARAKEQYDARAAQLRQQYAGGGPVMATLPDELSEPRRREAHAASPAQHARPAHPAGSPQHSQTPHHPASQPPRRVAHSRSRQAGSAGRSPGVAPPVHPPGRGQQAVLVKPASSLQARSAMDIAPAMERRVTPRSVAKAAQGQGNVAVGAVGGAVAGGAGGVGGVGGGVMGIADRLRSRDALRQAFILKEILDRPLAERDPLG